MRKADKIKLSVIVSVSLLAFFVGCVDTSVQPLPTSVDYHSQVSVVNLTAGGGAATVNLYGSIVNQDSINAGALALKYDYSGTQLNGTVNPGEMTAYKEIQSGAKAIAVTYANFSVQDTFKLAADTDFKLALYLIGTGSSTNVIKSTERYIWQTPGSTEGSSLFSSGKAGVRFLNAVADTINIADVVVSGGADTTITLNLGFKSGTGYMSFTSGSDYTFTVRDDNSDTLTTFTLNNAGSMKRYTNAIYGMKASPQKATLTDD